jgi:uncharacterized protein with PIN domain
MTRFYCDAMLGGLARWLRALGYQAEWEHGIEDAVLVERSLALGAVLLSSDRPLFERKPVKAGEVKALFVPRHAPVFDQLVFVLRTLHLSVRDLRCMVCGGDLVSVPRESVADEVPPAAYRACSDYWRCVSCQKLYWRGTHWARIEATRVRVAECLREAPDQY